ncbi:UNVERIFIED_CONTAM: hypothetical protein Slati_1677400 [Sesamum latifolium]|uniref:Uncharacterized protein n=1 Tax=Sesamum latifolium TaxID=2727402 RepID=A0AAW2WV38_9LAMI
MVACCTGRTTLIWIMASFVEKLGTSRQRNETLLQEDPVCHSYVSIAYPRLQRLYASQATTEQMTWHANHQTEEGSMCHPSHAEAWRHFARTHPDFVAELCNVRLGLCTDGFAPHGQYGCTYSYWLIILTPYNLPPRMCMSSGYMFLTMVISGPSNPKRGRVKRRKESVDTLFDSKHKEKIIDVYLDPLIEELQNLWHVGVLTRDSARDETFAMRAALMWTVNDL